MVRLFLTTVVAIALLISITKDFCNRQHQDSINSTGRNNGILFKGENQ